MGDFHAEIESIRSAASWMESNAIATAQKLQQTMNYLNSYAAQTDWSTVPSCVAFGASYNSAIEAYTTVAADLLSDATKMRDALNKIADDYEHADESSRDALNARLAAIGNSSYATTSAADNTYRHHRGDLHSDNPEAAPAQDATPGDSDSGPTGDGPAPKVTGGGRVIMQ